MKMIWLDGKFLADDGPALASDNRAFRYGDGLFETIRMVNGKMPLRHFHFERLLTSLQLLKYSIPDSFTSMHFEKIIIQLAQKNNCEKSARIRLTIFRGNGNLFENNNLPGCLIECIPLDEAVSNLNPDGLTIDIFQDARKSCDLFSNIKSASFLPYAMAAVYARDNKLSDCLVLNTRGNVADSTIANIFLVRDNTLFTPALTEGCIAGVMRRCLLEKFEETGQAFQETIFTEQDLLTADEIFLTNALNGVRWVKRFRNKEYPGKLTRKIYDEFVRTIFR